MFTVLTVVGTRPEAIKTAPVIRELARRSDEVRSVVCSTGQHRQMLDQVFRLFDIQADRELSVMQPNQSLAGLTARLLEALDGTAAEVNPDWILAQGDTTTVLAASMVAFYRGLRFGHIEAGLRTGDLRHPFPEEFNRRVADQVSTLHFAPTERARRTLLAEGFADENIRVTGNTVIDALQDVARQPYAWHTGPLKSIRQDARIVLITAHRRESFGEPLRQAAFAIRELVERFGGSGTEFVFPVHLNPNVQGAMLPILGGLEHLHLMEPLDYQSLVQLMQASALILTDSGGIQEEAPGLGVPVLVMRDTTERPEGVDAGVVKLVGTDRGAIVAAATELLSDESARQKMITGANPYGDGRAAERIVAALVERSA